MGRWSSGLPDCNDVKVQPKKCTTMSKNDTRQADKASHFQNHTRPIVGQKETRVSSWHSDFLPLSIVVQLSRFDGRLETFRMLSKA